MTLLSFFSQKEDFKRRTSPEILPEELKFLNPGGGKFKTKKTKNCWYFQTNSSSYKFSYEYKKFKEDVEYLRGRVDAGYKISIYP